MFLRRVHSDRSRNVPLDFREVARVEAERDDNALGARGGLCDGEVDEVDAVDGDGDGDGW